MWSWSHCAARRRNRLSEPPLVAQRVAREAQVFNRAAADQMFLDNALGVGDGDVAVPRPLRVHDRDRPGDADAQALALRSIARPVGAGDVQLLHTALEVVPRLLPGALVATVRAGAEEQVPLQLSDAERRRHHV